MERKEVPCRSVQLEWSCWLIHKPIAVLSIAGPARTGKSYILSRLLDSHDAFELGHTSKSQTHGIWIGTQALEYKDHVLVLLDTEGIGAVSADGTNDANILVMTLLMSSYFIYNSKGVPENDDLNKMRVFTTLAQSVAVKSQSAAQQDLMRHHFPSFLWLLRDVMLKLVGETKEEVTPREYLLQNVLHATEDSKSETDNVRKAILNFFPHFNCFVLPPPSTDPDIMEDIAVRHEELTAKFKSDVAGLVSLLMSSVTVKKGFQSSKPINGRTLALLAEQYIEAVNTPDAVPCLDDTWAIVARQRCSEIQNELIKKYRALMEQKIAETSKGLPLDFDAPKLEDASNSATPATIMSIHLSVYNELKKKLLKDVGPFISATDDSVKQDVVKKFKDAIVKGVLEELRKANEERSKIFCREELQKQYQPINTKIQSGDRSYTYRRYLNDLDRARRKYLSIARGPAKEEMLREAEKHIEQEKRLMKQRQDEYDKSKRLEEEARQREERTLHMVQQLQDDARRKEARIKELEDRGCFIM